jgi:hypothetical protein
LEVFELLPELRLCIVIAPLHSHIIHINFNFKLLYKHNTFFEIDVAEIYEILESWGFITKWKKQPTPNDSVLGHEDHNVVAWYHKVSIGLLEFYAWCDNYQKVKAIVNCHLRVITHSYILQEAQVKLKPDN